MSASCGDGGELHHACGLYSKISGYLQGILPILNSKREWSRRQGAHARIARHDPIERRDVLEALGLLDRLIESSGLLGEPFHLLGGEGSPW